MQIIGAGAAPISPHMQRAEPPPAAALARVEALAKTSVSREANGRENQTAAERDDVQRAREAKDRRLGGETVDRDGVVAAAKPHVDAAKAEGSAAESAARAAIANGAPATAAPGPAAAPAAAQGEDALSFAAAKAEQAAASPNGREPLGGETFAAAIEASRAAGERAVNAAAETAGTASPSEEGADRAAEETADAQRRATDGAIDASSLSQSAYDEMKTILAALH